MTRRGGEAGRQLLHRLGTLPIAPHVTDRELLGRFADRKDGAAFEALVRRHGAMVLAVARRVLGSTHDAEDVCQATFLLLAQKAAARGWEASVANWLHRAAHLLALKAHRSAVRRTRRAAKPAARPAADPLDEMTGRELLAALDLELLALPEVLRAALVLCYLEGVTRDEAAVRLGCPLATLKKRLEQGRGRLHAALVRRGLTSQAVLGTLLVGPPAAAFPVDLLRDTTAAALAGGPVPGRVGELMYGGIGMTGGTKIKAVLGAVLLGGLLAAGAVGSNRRDDRPVPADDAKKAVPAEKAAGPDELPRRGVLGASFSPVPPERAAELKLAPGVGAAALQPVAGLTADKAGLKAGDVVVALNGKPVGHPTVAAALRELPAGKTLTISVVRGDKPIELKTTLMEKPRDPGTANYEVIYSHVVSHGKRMRTILTKPKTPGKHPGFLFIQGFSPVSYDYTLAGSTGDVATIDGPILFDFASSGFVTLRVEKPGVGDSEGGPFAEMDYTTELDIYRQALKQLKETAGVDAGNVFIFGHSMGGAFGPMIAAENPVRGLVVYGVAARTWFEYILDTVRYQGLVGGGSFETADELVRQAARLLALVFLENKAVEEVKKSHPDLAGLADSLFPGGRFNGKSLAFWRQLQETNFAAYWAKCDSRVLAVKGVSDFVVYDVDHKLIADVVNRAHPGWGKSAVLPDSDHLFHTFATEADSMKNFQRGKFNPAFIKMAKDWIAGVMAAKD